MVELAFLLVFLSVTTFFGDASQVWPHPANITTGTDEVRVIRTGFKFAFAGKQTPKTLSLAFARYQTLTFPHHEDSTDDAAGSLKSVTVSVDDIDESHPQLETNESYVFQVDGAKATLHSATVWGALRGLETFSQLVSFDFGSSQYSIATPLEVRDAPRFPHRGLMIDTARHFLSLSTIRKVISSLPFAKINVLHWHMVDTQSFPFQSLTRPGLWNGSYSANERYTQADVADVVEFARLHGVRVVVEFDMPGHAASWCAGYPEVCPSASCTQPLNVANNATFDLIEDLLGECTGRAASAPGAPSGLFPDNFVHLGGDEVDTSCWNKSPEISAWLKAQGFSADDGYAYFVKRAAEIAIAQGRRPVQWVEVFDHFGSKLDNRTIVHVWKAKSTLPAVVKAGYQALINNSPGSDSWYLDHLGITWSKVYNNEPCQDIKDEAQCKLVLGGQGEMWGETVDNSDIEATVWPKLAAIAERLWSPREIKDAKAALPRIHNFRCLLNERGVAAAPVLNGNARSAPPRPGGCYVQRRR